MKGLLPELRLPWERLLRRSQWRLLGLLRLVLLLLLVKPGVISGRWVHIKRTGSPICYVSKNDVHATSVRLRLYFPDFSQLYI